LFCLLAFILIFGIKAIAFKLLENQVDEIYNGIIHRIILLIASVLLIYLVGQNRWNLFQISNIQISDILLVFILLGLFALNNLFFINQSDNFNYDSLLGLVFLRLTIGSIAEEFLYRGFIQTYINEKSVQKNKKISNGNLFASCLMTLAHLGFFTIMSTMFALTSLLLVFVFSLSVGYLRDKSNGIILPIITHLLINYLHFFIQTSY